MTATDTNLADADIAKLEEQGVLDREHWVDGPPHALFKELRGGCPVHWTREINEFPEEGGFWSVTTAEDIHTVSRDWQTYSSELGGVTAVSAAFPIELARAMFIGMDPPKHDWLKMLFQAGFTPRRIAAHEPAIRAMSLSRFAPASALTGTGAWPSMADSNSSSRAAGTMNRPSIHASGDDR